MQRAFEDAEIPALAIAALEPRMTNESADRHVLAAAVASNDAKTIVTSNLRHFPAAACQPFGVEVAHPDAFLCSVYERAPTGIHAVLDQAGCRSQSPADDRGRCPRSAPRACPGVRHAPASRTTRVATYGSLMEASARSIRSS